MLTLNDGRSELWQWDTGRKLTVDAECSQVHFSNKVFGRSIDVDVVDGVAIIPDILLQTDKDLTAWAFVGTAENGYTKISKTFKVNKRSKPADYVFTPQDQTTLEEITERLEDLENQKRPAGFVKTVNGIEPDENGNIDIPTGTGNAVQYVTQTLTDEQKQQARENIGASSGLISILGTDPTEPKEGQMWILKTTKEALTTPVIELCYVGENSIEIKLSNASFDESGSVVRSYNIYVDGALSKTETIEAGGTYTVTGLSPETEYQISIRGVNGAVLSKSSNTLTATTKEADVPEGEITIVIGVTAGSAGGNIGLNTWAGNVRATAVYTAGKKACVNQLSDDVYYPIPVPADATSITVVCPGMMFGYSGWNLASTNAYSYDVDSGFLKSGTTYTFEAGAAEYATVTFKKDSGDITNADLANITITFGTNSEPEPEPEPDYTPEFVVLRGYAGGNNVGNISLNERNDRSTAVYTAGKKACINGPSGEYYPIPVPADATSVTVVCPGYRYGYNGWNLSDANSYSYDVDSGWKDSGTTYTFEAGAAEYATVGFNALLPEEAIANITITFA